MRAREFTINIPINIKFNDSGDPEVDLTDKSPQNAVANADLAVNQLKDTPIDPSVPKLEPVMVPPLQQQIELQKAQTGKISPIIKDLTRDEVDPDTKELP